MDLETLRSENQALREQNAVLTDKLEALALELARLKKQLIGPKSERRPTGDGAQVGLFETPQPPANAPVAEPPAKTEIGRAHV